MADFCQECSIEIFGKDFKELANLLDASQYYHEHGALALCEGCGPVIVDINGRKMLPPEETSSQ